MDMVRVNIPKDLEGNEDGDDGDRIIINFYPPHLEALGRLDPMGILHLKIGSALRSIFGEDWEPHVVELSAVPIPIALTIGHAGLVLVINARPSIFGHDFV